MGLIATNIMAGMTGIVIGNKAGFKNIDIIPDLVLPNMMIILLVLSFQILQILWLWVFNSGPNKMICHGIELIDSGINYWRYGHAHFIAWNLYAGYRINSSQIVSTVEFLTHQTISAAAHEPKTEAVITFPACTFSVAQLTALLAHLDSMRHCINTPNVLEKMPT